MGKNKKLKCMFLKIKRISEKKKNCLSVIDVRLLSACVYVEPVEPFKMLQLMFFFLFVFQSSKLGFKIRCGSMGVWKTIYKND